VPVWYRYFSRISVIAFVPPTVVTDTVPVFVKDPFVHVIVHVPIFGTIKDAAPAELAVAVMDIDPFTHVTVALGVVVTFIVATFALPFTILKIKRDHSSIIIRIALPCDRHTVLIYCFKRIPFCQGYAGI
jgi:hypothetical protein